MAVSAVVCFFAALLGLTEEERLARTRAEQLQAELGTAESAKFLFSMLGQVALSRGEAVKAAELLARACTVDEESGDSAGLSTDAALRAHALIRTGDYAGARHEADRALESGATDDIFTQGLACSALAWLAALSGADPDDVRRHMTAALTLGPKELLLNQALIHVACAEAARLLGDETTSCHHRQQAIDLYEAKENAVGAAVQRALL